MIKGHQSKLIVTIEQAQKLDLCCNAYRWGYNHLFASRKNFIKSEFSRIRTECLGSDDTQGPLPETAPKFDWSRWEYARSTYIKRNEYPEFIPENAQLSTVFHGLNNTFPKKPSGFRKKGVHKQHFVCSHTKHMQNVNGHIKLNFIGLIKLAKPIPIDADLRTLGIHLKNGKWYVGMSIETSDELPPLRTIGLSVGIDVGVRSLATTFDGATNVQFKRKDKTDEIKRLETEKRIWERRKSRRHKRGISNQSKRHDFALMMIQKLSEKIAAIMNDNIHQISHRILKKNVKDVTIETLNVKGMLTKSKVIGKKSIGKGLRRGITNARMSTLLSQLKYKASWRGIDVKSASQFFPSSQLCSQCKHRNKPEGEEWDCENCNVHHNRDENASINLRDFGNSHWVETKKNVWAWKS